MSKHEVGAEEVEETEESARGSVRRRWEAAAYCQSAVVIETREWRPRDFAVVESHGVGGMLPLPCRGGR